MSKKLFGILLALTFLFNLAAPALADTNVTTTGSSLTTNQTVATTAPSTQPTSEEVAEAGTLPDSPFYFLDQLVEKIVLIFTFSPENKANVLLQDANERLAESQVMADEAKQDLATKTAQAYVDTLQAAQVQVTIALQDNQVSGSVYNPATTANSVTSVVYGKKDSSVVAVVYGLDISQRNAAQVLLRVLAKAPEQARKGLMNAFTNVIKHELDENANITVVVNGQTVNIGNLFKHKNSKHKEAKHEEANDVQSSVPTVSTTQASLSFRDGEKDKAEKTTPKHNVATVHPSSDARPSQNGQQEHEVNKEHSSNRGSVSVQPQEHKSMESSREQRGSERDD